MEKWFVTAKKADFQEIGKKFHIDQVTARIIRNRDMIGEEAIREFLYGDIQDLHNPHLLKDCDKAVSLLVKKIEERKKIRVLGDYDIDGVNATYIFYTGLKKCGANVDFEIPDRMKDGYGLNSQLIQLAWQEGVDTILTCDNGIASVKEISEAKQLGMTVIITDHHEPQTVLPNADAIVNHKQVDCAYPFKGLCGAAIAYKIICCLYEVCGFSQDEANLFLEYAAIATVGDVMDLYGENRIIVKEGLKLLNQTNNFGLQALIQVNELGNSTITSYHIGFVLGPCINASGRLDTAKLALSLLTAENAENAYSVASELKKLNDERKLLTMDGVVQAIDMIESSSLKEDSVLVVYLPECHESLAGIIAGRIRERYHKPTFILTRGKESVKGSGRSIDTYNMFQKMCLCSELFTKFGGHPMAAGLSLPEENIEKFRICINRDAQLTNDDFINKVMIDVPMPIDYIKEELVEELKVLEPFGKGNPKPLFAEKNIKVISARILGKNNNVLKMQVVNERGTALDALYFGDVDEFQSFVIEKYGVQKKEELFQGRAKDVVIAVTYYPSMNEYNNKKTLQIIIQNYQ